MKSLRKLILKYRYSLLKRWLRKLGHPHYRELAKHYDGVYIVPQQTYFPEQSSFLYYGKKVVETCPLSSLKKHFSTKKIAIVGSGPSINDLNLSKLENVDCILLNGTISLIDSHKIRPSLITIIDEQFCRDRFELIKTIPQEVPLLLSDRAIRQIIKIDYHFFINRQVYLANFDLFHQYDYQEKYFDDEKISQLEYGFLDGGTVMATALQMAIAFKIAQTIYLLGFDIGNANQARFNEQDGKQLPSYLLSHFDTRILPFMKCISQYCKRNNQVVLNCSSQTKLSYEIFAYSNDFSR